MNIVDYINRVKDIELACAIPVLPKLNLISEKMLADFLCVERKVVRNIYNAHKAKLEELGARRVEVKEFIALGYNCESCKSGWVLSFDDYSLNVVRSFGYTFLYSKECVVYIDDILCKRQKLHRNLNAAAQVVQPNNEVVDDMPAEAGVPAVEMGDITSPEAGNDLFTFTSDAFGSIRTIMRDGDPWFVAADVCRALELDQVTNALRKLDDDEKALISIKGISRGNENTNIINEPGLYSIVLGSRKPEAKAFKRWITHDVIPSIRKNGAYIMGQETLSETELIAKALIACNKIVEDQKIQIAKLKCKNDILLANAQAWEYPSIINAFMRKYACTCCAGSFESAWSELYRNLQYKHHINLKIRKAKPNTSYMKRALPDELPIIAQTALAMCESAGLDAAAIINEVNIAALTS